MIEKGWESMPLKVDTEKEGLTNTIALRKVAEEDLVKLFQMKASPFNQPHMDTLLHLSEQVLHVSNTLTFWHQFQSRWLRLRPVMQSEDMKTQMPMEARKYYDIDTKYHNILNKAKSYGKASHIYQNKKLLATFENGIKVLEDIYSGIERYLDMKRSNCPRLNFMANDQLLILIADPNFRNNESYISFIFPHVKAVLFAGKDENAIKSLIGVESFDSNVKCTLLNAVPCEHKSQADHDVTSVVNHLEKEIQLAVRHDVLSALRGRDNPNHSNSFNSPDSVAVELSLQFLWELVKRFLPQSHGAVLEILLHRAEESHDSDVIHEFWKDILNALRTEEMTSYHRECFETALLISKKFIRKKTDFDRQVSLRHQVDGDNITLSTLGVHVNYSFEFVGSHNRIVLTPSMEVCQRHILLTLGVGVSCDLHSHSGDGLDTVKHLATAVFQDVRVFSFAFTNSLLHFARIIKGISQCKSWVILRDMGCIDPTLLPLIANFAQQVSELVQLNKTSSSLSSEMNNSQHVVVPRSPQVFIAEFHRELSFEHRHFRVIQIGEPDTSFFVQYFLEINNCSNSFSIGAGIKHIARVMNEELFRQKNMVCTLHDLQMIIQHTDFSSCEDIEEEEICLVNEFMHYFMHRIPQQDIKDLFSAVGDVFPNVPIENAVDETSALAQDMLNEMGFTNSDALSSSIAAIYYNIEDRSHSLVFGKCSAGKSTAIKIATMMAHGDEDQEEKQKEEGEVQEESIDEKKNADASTPAVGGKQSDIFEGWPSQTDVTFLEAFEHSTLFGFHGDSGWNNGALMENVTNGKISVHIFDFNMSNSKKVESILALADLTMTDNVLYVDGGAHKINNIPALVFETLDLRDTAPSLVNRCSYVYIQQSDDLYSTLIDSILANYATLSHHEMLEIEELLMMIFRDCASTFEEVLPLNMTKQCFASVFEGIMTQEIDDDIARHSRASGRNHSTKQNTPKLKFEGVVHAIVLAALVIFENHFGYSKRAQVRSVIANCVPRKFFRTFENMLADNNAHLYYDRRKQRIDILPDFEQRVIASGMGQVMYLPTKDFVYHLATVEMLRKSNLNISLFGPRCSGKTSFLKYLDEHIKFSSTSSPNIELIENLMLNKLQRRRERCYGPPAGEKFMLFVDDIDLNHSVSEYVRSMLALSCIASRQQGRFIRFESIRVLCCSKTTLYERLQRYFVHCRIQQPEIEELKTIYSEMFTTFVDKGLGTSTVQNVFERCTKLVGVDSTPLNFHALHQALRLVASNVSPFLSDKETTKSLISETVQMSLQYYSMPEAGPLFSNLDIKTGLSCGKIVKIPPLEYESFSSNVNQNFHDDIPGLSDQLPFYHLKMITTIARITALPESHVLLLGPKYHSKTLLVRMTGIVTNASIFQVTIASDWKKHLKRSLERAMIHNKPAWFFLDLQKLHDHREALTTLYNLIVFKNFECVFSPDELRKITKQSPRGKSSRDSGSSSPRGARGSYRSMNFIANFSKNFHAVFISTELPSSSLSEVFKYFFTLDIAWLEETDLSRIISRWLPSEAEMGAILEKHLKTSLECDPKSFSKLLAKTHDYLRNNLLDVNNRTLRDTAMMSRRFLMKGGEQLGESYIRMKTMSAFLETAERDLSDLKLKTRALEPQISLGKENKGKLIGLSEDNREKRQRLRENIDDRRSRLKTNNKTAEDALSEVRQAIKDSTNDLTNLRSVLIGVKKAELSGMKTVSNPDPAVHTAFAFVCILKGIEPRNVPNCNAIKSFPDSDYWPEVKILLSDPKFLTSLVEFDHKQLSDKTLELCEILFEELSDEGQDSFINGTCTAFIDRLKGLTAYTNLCLAIFRWAISTFRLSWSKTNLQPRIDALEERKNASVTEEEYLAKKDEELQSLGKESEELKRKIQEEETHLTKLSGELESTEARHSTCQKIFNSLDRHRASLQENLKKFHFTAERLPQYTILFASLIAATLHLEESDFLEAFHGICEIVFPTEKVETIRDGLQGIVSDFCLNEMSSFKNTNDKKYILSTFQQLLGSNDDLLLCRLLAPLETKRNAVFVDTFGQAMNIYKKVFLKRTVHKIYFRRSNADDIMDFLMKHMQKPHTIFIEYIEGNSLSDKKLFEILCSDMKTEMGSYYVDTSDSKIHCHPKHRLVLVIRHQDYNFCPELREKLPVINFGLGPVLRATLRSSILEESARNELEIRKLSVLGNSQDLTKVWDTIYNTLSTTKKSWDPASKFSISLLESFHDIENLSRQARKLEEPVKHIESAVNVYRSSIDYSMLVYEMVQDLGRVDPLHHISFDEYRSCFKLVKVEPFAPGKSPSKSPKNRKASATQKDVEQYEPRADGMFLSVFWGVCKILSSRVQDFQFNLFSFGAYVKVMEKMKKIDEAEALFILRDPDLEPDASENEILQMMMSKSNKFAKFANSAQMMTWVEAVRESKVDFSALALSNASTLRCLLLSKFLNKPMYCKALKVLGERAFHAKEEKFQHYTLQEHLDFEERIYMAYKQSSPTRPIFLVTDKDSYFGDGVDEIMALNENNNVHCAVMPLEYTPFDSLRRTILEASDRGTWVVLRHAHLLQDLSQLHSVFGQLNPRRVHDNFRLWFTSNPSISSKIYAKFLDDVVNIRAPNSTNQIRKMFENFHVAYNKRAIKGRDNNKNENKREEDAYAYSLWEKLFRCHFTLLERRVARQWRGMNYADSNSLKIMIALLKNHESNPLYHDVHGTSHEETSETEFWYNVFADAVYNCAIIDISDTRYLQSIAREIFASQPIKDEGKKEETAVEEDHYVFHDKRKDLHSHEVVVFERRYSHLLSGVDHLETLLQPLDIFAKEEAPKAEEIEISTEAKVIEEILARLPTELNVPKTYLEYPPQTIVAQLVNTECQLLNKLVSQMRTDLVQLAKAIAKEEEEEKKEGEEDSNMIFALSIEDEALLSVLVDSDEIPGKWRALGNPFVSSLSSTSTGLSNDTLDSFLDRVNILYESLYANVHKGSTCHAIGYYYHPRALLSGFRRQHARNSSVSMHMHEMNITLTNILSVAELQEQDIAPVEVDSTNDDHHEDTLKNTKGTYYLSHFQCHGGKWDPSSGKLQIHFDKTKYGNPLPLFAIQFTQHTQRTEPPSSPKEQKFNSNIVPCYRSSRGAHKRGRASNQSHPKEKGRRTLAVSRNISAKRRQSLGKRRKTSIWQSRKLTSKRRPSFAGWQQLSSDETVTGASGSNESSARKSENKFLFRLDLKNYFEGSIATWHGLGLDIFAQSQHATGSNKK
eukprot:g1222.t1